MVWLIARKEMTEQIRDGRFKLATLIVLLLSLASLIAGWQSYREFKAQHQLAEEAEWQRWLNQGEKSSHSAAHYGIFVFKPQMPLSIIDKGIDPYVGVTARLEVHTQNIFQFRPVEDSTSLRRFGEVTVASTAQILVPLMIVILTFNSFAGERQQGTLRQILSIGVKSRSLIIGKVIGSSLPLFIILIPLSMVCSVVILANTLTDSVSNNILKLLVMTLGYIVYFTIFIGMGLAVSAKSVSSRQALIVLLFFWFINCLMAPPVVMDVADRIFSSANALEFASAIREEKLKMTTWYKRLGELEERLLKQHNVDSVEKLPVSPTGIALVEQESEGDKIQQKYFDLLNEAHQKQLKVYRLGAVFAPMLALQSLSMGLAGTDYYQHYHFAEAAEKYRRNLVDIMNRDEIENSDPKDPPYIPKMRGKDLWEKVPKFYYQAPNFSWIVSNHKTEIVLLLVWAFVAVVIVSKVELKVD